MKNPFNNTKYLISETDPLRLPNAEGEVAFIGRSNVGKSMTLCALTDNKSLARVSKTPGRTRAINVFEVKRGRWLVDLPGYGHATGPKREKNYWPRMIETYLKIRPNLKMTYLLIDAEFGLTQSDLASLRWMGDNNIPGMVVGVKVDRLKPNHQNKFRSRLAQQLGLKSEEIHWISSKKKYGIKAFQGEVLKALGLG